ncbi:MAG: hypothetical protein PWQ22_634 [Archaeoglobaceae archaeon]|nr:hypothetical protein [Archaeoglobaceae archaeon]
MSYLKAIEIVGKVLILVPTLTMLLLLIYAIATGRSVSVNGSGFCIGMIIACGLALVAYVALKEIKAR